jgi:hypothetical protein
MGNIIDIKTLKIQNTNTKFASLNKELKELELKELNYQVLLVNTSKAIFLKKMEIEKLTKEILKEI